MPDMSSGVTLDAKDGKMLDYDNTNSLDKKITDLDENQKKSFLESYKPIQKLDKELSSSSAEAIMKSLVHEIYGNDYNIESINYQDNNNNAFGPGFTCWSGHFIKKDSPNDIGYQGEITIDSSTRQVVSISKFNPFDKFGSANDNSVTKFTWDQAYAKAIETVKKYFPDKVKDVNTQQTYINPSVFINHNAQVDRFYAFNFNRLVNGISYQNDGVSINLNSVTGEISNIYSRWCAKS